MNRYLSLGILAAGIILIVFGVGAADSFTSDVSRMFNGAPNDKTLWLLGGGAALAAIGGYGLSRGGSQ